MNPMNLQWVSFKLLKIVPKASQNVSPNDTESPHPKRETSLSDKSSVLIFGRKSYQSSCRSPEPHVELPNSKTSYFPKSSGDACDTLCTSAESMFSFWAICSAMLSVVPFVEPKKYLFFSFCSEFD